MERTQDQDMPEFIGCSHPEWSRMWAALEAIEGNPSCDCPCCHAYWQYMGSAAKEGKPQWTHAFRHRHHPKTKARRYIAIPASVEFDQETIKRRGL